MKYNVTIQEILERTVEVEADSKQEAESIVREKYRHSDIVLDAGDHVETRIETNIRRL